MPSESALLRDITASRPTATTRPFVAPESLPAVGRDEPNADRLGALVLTRRLSESILVGGQVEVVINEIRSGTVRLMVVAPRSIRVDRREVFDAIRSEPSSTTPASEPLSLAASVVPRPGDTTGRLVLSRSAGQSIMIGDEVEIAVVEVRPSVVKLRISAPKSVKVDRREVFEARQNGPANGSISGTYLADRR